MDKKVNLHEHHRQRMKNRALIEGLDNFEPHNVLELMLFFVLPQVDTNDIAHELINRFGSFEAVFSAPIEELVKITGVKHHAATFLKLLPEFSRYYAQEQANPKIVKRPSKEQIAEMFLSYFIGRTEETVVCMFLDEKGYLIDIKPMFSGSINSVSFSYRQLVNEALCLNAYKVAVAHNHPSSAPIPSQEDIDTYRNLKRSLAQMHIDLIDSYIVAGGKCVGTEAFKFAAEGRTIPIS